MKKFILGYVCILVGCAAQNLTPENIHVENGNYIKYVSSQSSKKTKNDFMKVNINGETYEDTELYYRIVWFDESGMPINTAVLDRPVQSRVRRDIPFNWSAIAPNADANSYQVYISKRPIKQ